MKLKEKNIWVCYRVKDGEPFLESIREREEASKLAFVEKYGRDWGFWSYNGIRVGLFKIFSQNE